MLYFRKKANPMMPQNSYKDWFPHILIGLTILLALAAGWWAGERAEEHNSPAVQDSVRLDILSGVSYRDAVDFIFERYLLNRNREEAFAALFDMRVDASLRDQHLELILLFDNIDYSQQEVVNYAENYLANPL